MCGASVTTCTRCAVRYDSDAEGSAAECEGCYDARRTVELEAEAVQSQAVIALESSARAYADTCEGRRLVALLEASFAVARAYGYVHPLSLPVVTVEVGP